MKKPNLNVLVLLLITILCCLSKSATGGRSFDLQEYEDQPQNRLKRQKSSNKYPSQITRSYSKSLSAADISHLFDNLGLDETNTTSSTFSGQKRVVVQQTSSSGPTMVITQTTSLGKPLSNDSNNGIKRIISFGQIPNNSLNNAVKRNNSFRQSPEKARSQQQLLPSTGDRKRALAMDPASSGYAQDNDPISLIKKALELPMSANPGNTRKNWNFDKENMPPTTVIPSNQKWLREVGSPTIPEDRKDKVIKEKIAIEKADDGGYIVNGYHVPVNFKLDAAQVEKFKKEIVDTHNLLRAKHGAPPLVLKQEISNFSQWWANQLLAMKVFKHSDKKVHPFEMGENLYWAGIPYVPGRMVVESWYAEGEDVNYDYSSTTSTPGAGHYTQVLWKSSNEIGVGLASHPQYGFHVVCNYRPPGNYEGLFAKNVLPPLKS